MRAFTALQQKLSTSPRARFIAAVVSFYVLMMIIYGYVILANLSDAPQFVYAQF